MTDIKAVLFDLDDTLWSIVPVIVRAEAVLFDWLTKHTPVVAQRFSIENLRRRRLALLKDNPQYAIDLRALRHAALCDIFVECGEDKEKVDQAMAVFSEARNAVTPFEDVHPVLTRLQERFSLGSISNGVADLVTIGLDRYFRVSVAAHSFGTAKPDPAIFHAACEALNVAPDQAVYVGDDPVLDVQGAQGAGLHAIWMNRSALEPRRILPDHIQPDAVCTTLYELDDWLTQRIMSSGIPRPCSIK